jgi:DNA-binding response OmpR family regulator
MKNILVIEDSKTMNNIITKELSNLGFEVSQAFKLCQAKEFLIAKKYQLIILDLHLPDGEGSELIANIQSLTKTKVVVLTSTQDEDLREELFGYGILDYIIKDKNLLYSISEIIKIINTITANKKDKILVIDDSKFICKQIKTILEPRNYKITKALTATEGLNKLYEEEFKLIILDMELPDIHGIKVLEIIRKDNRFLALPILVLSGTYTPEIVRNSLKNGASDFLKKPFIFEEFILKIDLWIDYFHKKKTLDEKTLELEFLNNNLEKVVAQEVEKNRQKDKLLFAKSRQAQMGEMISMIAHQWKQPLSAMSASVALLNLRSQTQKLDPATTKKITININKYIKYLSNTIDDFRDFFKPQKEMRVSNFELIVSKTLSLVEESIKSKNIELIINEEQIKEFLTYENELVQVVLNLLKNAEDAFNDKDIKQPQISITIKANSLSIEDNAGGIDEDVIEKIFDPYFSTKGKTGTGLGLYMSKMIIEEHCNGELDVVNLKDGACFNIILPNVGNKR